MRSRSRSLRRPQCVARQRGRRAKKTMAPHSGRSVAQQQERHAKNDGAARQQERYAITEAPFAQPPIACRNSGQLFEVCNPFPALFFASCQFIQVCNPFSNNLGTRLPLLAFRPCIRKDVTRRFRNQHDAPPLLDALRTPSTPKNIVQRITYLGKLAELRIMDVKSDYILRKTVIRNVFEQMPIALFGERGLTHT